MGLFGGGNSSSTNSTTNNNYDNRQVITSDTKNYDLSDNSTKVDNSTSVVNLLDGGAIAGMAAATKGAYDYADNVFDAATVYANGVNNNSLDAFKVAAELSSDALTSTRASYSDATKQVANAYGNAAAIQSDALNGAKSAFTEATKQVGAAWNTATDSILSAFKTAQVATADAQAATQSAYADAKGTSGAQQKIIFAVLAVAAVMALATMRK
ncbi:hypothetical protein [Duganella radicis]|uniref:Uncharacterized protein n=1 Tax=Duganella radicis TaxID=551988 RepID=A0A6L6PBE1_9BURK|nr:hypothetical protein [Duganella radicis]MTV36280.1 hypothetical protein [Duganella radicis]